MKIFNLRVCGIKRLETEIFFVEQILDEVMKLTPIGFLSILKMQYVIGKVFSFSVTLKPNCLVYSLFSSINSAQLLIITTHRFWNIFYFHIQDYIFILILSKPNTVYRLCIKSWSHIVQFWILQWLPCWFSRVSFRKTA